MKVQLGLSLMHEPEFLKAALPLFQNGDVDILEWSFDTIRYEKHKPKWLDQLLKEYSKNDRLIGHGVRYSLFDAKWTKRQTRWIDQLKKEVKKYKYNHITEHFGFMSSADFHKGAPLPVPLTKATLAMGINRLRQIQEASQLPVGVENLAFSFSEKDVKEQAEFLKKLIKPINGFLILDLHNIYCQAKNFEMNIDELIDLYPLDKVKEIHVSGGSWQKSIYTKSIITIRRDTHDEKIPTELFSVLENTLKKCKYLEYVIFERLGHTLGDEKEQKQFRNDFLRLKKIVSAAENPSGKKSGNFNSKNTGHPPINDSRLYKQQQFIVKTLHRNKDPKTILETLKNGDLKDWNISNWNDSMVEAANFLIKRWG